MTKISDIMTRGPAYLRSEETVQAAAQMMADMDIGAVPICDGRRLVGVLTDRDIAVRCVAKNQSASESKVSDAMTDEVRWCFEDDSVDDAKQKMESAQIRRLPIVDRNHQLVGMLSLGDVATREGGTQETLAQISEPSQPRSP